MTVAELRKQLDAFGPDEHVLVAVRVFTRAFAVAQQEPFAVDHSYSGCTIPRNMHVVARKAE
jgi:hypothetical protein